MDWVCVYAKPSSSHDLQTSIICDPIKYSLPDSSIYQSTILNITDTLILVNINFLLALMQSKTNLTTTVFIHILVLVPILGIGAWFVCLSFVMWCVQIPTSCTGQERTATISCQQGAML